MAEHLNLLTTSADFADMSEYEGKKQISERVSKTPVDDGWQAHPLDVYTGLTKEELNFELDLYRAKAAEEGKLCSELKMVKALAVTQVNQLKSRLEVCEQSRNVLLRVDQALDSLPDVLCASTPEVKVEPDPKLLKELEAEVEKGKMLEKELEEKNQRLEFLQKHFSKLSMNVSECKGRFQRAAGDESLEG